MSTQKTKVIAVEIDEAGGVKIEGHGFVGPDCARATAYLESALGAKTSSTKKPDWNEKAVNVQQVKQR